MVPTLQATAVADSTARRYRPAHRIVHRDINDFLPPVRRLDGPTSSSGSAPSLKVPPVSRPPAEPPRARDRESPVLLSEPCVPEPPAPPDLRPSSAKSVISCTASMCSPRTMYLTQQRSESQGELEKESNQWKEEEYALGSKIVKHFVDVHVLLDARAVQLEAQAPRERLHLVTRHCSVVDQVNFVLNETLGNLHVLGVSTIRATVQQGRSRTSPHSSSTFLIHVSIASNESRSTVEKHSAHAPCTPTTWSERVSGAFQRSTRPHVRRTAPL